MNDPFEFAGIDLRNSKLRVNFKCWRKQVNDTTGIVSFGGAGKSLYSRSHYNPVMWAHYADNHAGVCLEFEIPDKLLEAVKYISTRPKTEKFKCKEEIFFTKFRKWKYENEVRIIKSLCECRKENGLYFFSFGNELKLKSIFLGGRFDEKKFQDNLRQIRKSFPETQIVKKRPAFGAFRIVKQQNWELTPK